MVAPCRAWRFIISEAVATVRGKTGSYGSTSSATMTRGMRKGGVAVRDTRKSANRHNFRKVDEQGVVLKLFIGNMSD